MKRNRYLSIGAALVMAAFFQACTLTTYAQTNCGDEGQSTCTRGNTDFYINNGNQGCQQDLKSQNGNCVNDIRHTVVADSAWANWAMAQQRQIAKNAQINWITTMGTHNSYSSLRQGYSKDVGTNQVLSISDQLEHGARILEIDPHAYLYDLDTHHLTVCHSGDGILYGYHYNDLEGCSYTSPDQARFLGTVFQEIRTWLNKNPGEVLTLFIDVGGPTDNYITKCTGIDCTQSDYSQDFSNDVASAFGDLVWTTTDTDNLNGGHMPSIQEMLYAGTQVIMMSNGDLKTPYVHPYYYYSANNPLPPYLLPGMSPANSDDTVYPNIQFNSNSDFGHFCNFNDGSGNNPDSFDQTQRGRDAWFRIAEGRSGSDDSSNGTQQKLVEEEQVRGASLCTASYIELDYLYELDRVPSSDYRRTDKPDTRFDASIWSWKEGENGQGQSAVMSLSEDGRWISGFVADSSEHVQRYPAACMVNTGQFPPYWGLQSWFVTPTAVPLYDRRNARGDLIEAGANLACIAHHGLFVPPYNAHENAEIYKAARASGGGDKYWINYTNNPDSPHFVVTPQTFRFLQGGEPAPAQVTIVGVPNKTVDLKLVQVPSEATVTLSTSSVPLDDNGRGTFTIHLAARPDMPLGQNFAAGVTANYDGNKSALEVLPVQTFVTNQPDIQLNVQQTGHSEEAPIKVVAQITNITPGVKYQGTLSLYDLQDSPRGPVQVTLDSIKVVDWQIPVIAHTFYLPAGVHNLTAGYEPGGWTTVTENVQTNPINPSQTVPILILEPPDGVHLPAGSNTVTLSTTPHIELPSYAQTFSMPYGGALPASVSLKAVGTGSVAISSNQPWLSASWTSSSGRTPTYFVNLSLTSQAQRLAPGTYQAAVTLLDRQAATNPSWMMDHVTVTLHVTTRLSASPARVELTTAHPETYVHLISANGGNVPFTVTSDAAWLTAESDAMVFKLVADPTKVGNIVKYATVSVHSEDAPEVQLTVKFTP